jgi:hypothetical protein
MTGIYTRVWNQAFTDINFRQSLGLDLSTD